MSDTVAICMSIAKNFETLKSDVFPDFNAQQAKDPQHPAAHAAAEGMRPQAIDAIRRLVSEPEKKLCR